MALFHLRSRRNKFLINKWAKMINQIKKCPNCKSYTLHEVCPNCQTETENPTPPPFSPEDKFGEYRRKAKKEKN